LGARVFAHLKAALKHVDEIDPRIRGPAASIATAFNWTCTFIVTKTFLDLQASYFCNEMINFLSTYWSILPATLFFVLLFSFIQILAIELVYFSMRKCSYQNSF